MSKQIIMFNLLLIRNGQPISNPLYYHTIRQAHESHNKIFTGDTTAAHPQLTLILCRCVSLTKSLATIQKLKLSENNQSEYFWQWVGHNDPDTIVNTKEMTLVAHSNCYYDITYPYRVVDNAWLLLQKHLMMDNNCRKYQSCVARRIVTMGGTLPQWLIDHYKVNKFCVHY